MAAAAMSSMDWSPERGAAAWIWPWYQRMSWLILSSCPNGKFELVAEMFFRGGSLVF